MVSPPPSLHPLSLVKWTLPISLVVTMLGLWWHSSRKKPKPPGETAAPPLDSKESVPVINGTAKANGCVSVGNKTCQVPQTDNPDLNAFIETVYKLNAGTLDTTEKPLTNGWTHSTPKLETAVCTTSVKAQAPTTPVTARAKRSTPQPCTPPSVEKLVVAKSVKYLESSDSVLNSSEFGVAKIEEHIKKTKKSPTTSPGKKTWSELVAEDSETEELAGRASSGPSIATAEELQFRIDHLVSSSDVTTLTSSSPPACCDSTTVDSTLSNSPPDYRNTKSYSEAAANAEVVNIITQQSGATSETLAARDSANHSPNVEDMDHPHPAVMLSSPSLSDVHSEGSSDSGKGCSEASSSSSRIPAGGSSTPTPYDALAAPSTPTAPWTEHNFVLPQHIVGRLIGKAGTFIHRVRSTTHTKMYIKRHPHSHKLKICAVEGTQENVAQALAMIRQKFPLSLYPFLTLEKVPYLAPDTISCTLRPEPFQLTLVEGINNDVCISSLVSAGHFFVQLPSHPSYASLESLNLLMNTTYSSSQAPLLPAPVENALVAAPAMGGWFRGQILAVDTAAGGCCQVKFVDYGGYATLQARELRQIRADFLALPFQAIECGLANVVPAPASQEGESSPEEVEVEWSEEARQVVHGFTSGHVLQAQVYDYDVNTTMPLVYLYTLHDSEIVLVNQELVARGLARLDPQAAHLVSTTDSTSTDSKVSPSSISSIETTQDAAAVAATSGPDGSSSQVSAESTGQTGVVDSAPVAT